jgi:hypothetical protein
MNWVIKLVEIEIYLLDLDKLIKSRKRVMFYENAWKKIFAVTPIFILKLITIVIIRETEII